MGPCPVGELGEGLARCAASEQAYRPRSKQPRDALVVFARHVPAEESNPWIVRAERVRGLFVDIDPGFDSDSGLDETMGQPAGTAEQVHCADSAVLGDFGGTSQDGSSQGDSLCASNEKFSRAGPWPASAATTC